MDVVLPLVDEVSEKVQLLLEVESKAFGASSDLIEERAPPNLKAPSLSVKGSVSISLMEVATWTWIVNTHEIETFHFLHP